MELNAGHNYFKESLLYDCTERKKFLTSLFGKEMLHVLNISDDLFLKQKVNFHLPRFLMTFFLFNFLIFVQASDKKYKSTTAHQNFLWPMFPSFPRNLSFFRPCFRPSRLQSYKYTTAEFTFYNRKWHFTTAEIVISYTLRYALTKCVPWSICGLSVEWCLVCIEKWVLALKGGSRLAGQGQIVQIHVASIERRYTCTKCIGYYNDFPCQDFLL